MAKPIIPYAPEIAARILDQLAAGKSLRSICKGSGMPSATNVREWAVKDTDFGARYARARAEGLEHMAEEIVDIADDGTNDYQDDGMPDYDHLQRSKLRVDTRKWLLSKLVPKIYGDKQVIEHQGEIKLTDRLLRARNRAG